jgi:hypothetical protein
MPGSVHWIKDPDLASDPDPALFVSGFQDANFFFLMTYCRYGSGKCTYGNLQDNKSFRSHKKLKIKYIIVVNQQGSK